MRPAFPEHIAPTSAAAAAHSSGWRSPVPYLFDGLAAMLGLIAFTLLVLACSYRRTSGFLDASDADADTPTPTSAASANPAGRESAPGCLEELGFVVVMAGDSKPTFLATPRPPPLPFGSLLDSTTAGKLTGGAAEEDEDEERKANGEFTTQQ